MKDPKEEKECDQAGPGDVVRMRGQRGLGEKIT
jgi:hypothetical protein